MSGGGERKPNWHPQAPGCPSESGGGVSAIKMLGVYAIGSDVSSYLRNELRGEMAPFPFPGSGGQYLVCSGCAVGSSGAGCAAGCLLHASLCTQPLQFLTGSLVNSFQVTFRNSGLAGRSASFLNLLDNYRLTLSFRRLSFFWFSFDYFDRHLADMKSRDFRLHGISSNILLFVRY